jgi:hypothetical protein
VVVVDTDDDLREEAAEFDVAAAEDHERYRSGDGDRLGAGVDESCWERRIKAPWASSTSSAIFARLWGSDRAQAPSLAAAARLSDRHSDRVTDLAA